MIYPDTTGSASDSAEVNQQLREKIEALEQQLKEHAEALKQQQEITQEHQKIAQELQRKLNTLSLTNKNDKRYVASISQTAKSPQAREKFYKTLVHEDNAWGAFVNHRFYTEFVKGARRMTAVDRSNNAVDNDMIITDDLWKTAVEAVEKKANEMFSTLLKNDNYNLEEPQSGRVPTLIRLALDTLNAGTGEGHGIDLVHQYNWNYNTDKDMLFDAVNTGNKKSSKTSSKPSKTSSKPSNTSEPSKTSEPYKVTFTSDVAVWFHDTQDGDCELALIEYKKNNDDNRSRVAQSDMAVNNVVNATNKPCLAVDIAGGLYIQQWGITASAIVPNPYDGPTYVKSSMLGHQVRGAEGIVRLAAGLLRAKSSFLLPPNDQLGQRVGLVPEDGNVFRVMKAYDESTYCKPNIHLVKSLLCPDVRIWTSKDKKLQLVEMKYFDSNWSNGLNKKISIFVDILQKLQVLHCANLVHGDIRLSNMLSTGHLIDFDFVGNKCYPEGLQAIRDGERHEEVKKAIRNDTIGKLSMNLKHDLYSMGAVLKLFTPVKDQYNQTWASASSTLMGTSPTIVAENLNDSVLKDTSAMLADLISEEVSFNGYPGTGDTGNTNKVLMGTGGTPKRIAAFKQNSAC